jgi:hypothetical protein
MSTTFAIRHAVLSLAMSSLACLGLPAGLGAQRSSAAAHALIPSSVREEHHEIQTALSRAATAGGRTGPAARALLRVLQPHFEREEQIALPPLGLLAPWARGDSLAAPDWLLPMTDSLRRELPRMLREHVAIRSATRQLGEAARADGRSSVVRLSETLAMHARSEEEVLYPAAVLVGDLVRARTAHR